MKKILAFMVLLAILIPACFGFTGGIIAIAATNEKLIVYNWSGYMDLSLLTDFEDFYYEKYGVRITVEYDTYETNEEMITKVLLGDMPMDLICPSEYAIEKLLRNDMLKKVNFSKIPNYSNIDSMIMEIIAEIFGDLEVNGEPCDMNEYFVPYMWGTLGILYNENVVSEEDLELGWGLLWNKGNNPLLDKKILMKDSVRDAYVAAILYAKEEGLLDEYEEYAEMSVQELINTIDDVVLPIVESVLREQSKVVKGYEVDFGKDDMLRGIAYLDLAWSGDALYAIELCDEETPLNYFVPESGSNVWFDGWVVPKKVQNERAALEFINFMCDPESAILNMMETGYTSALDKEVLRENEFVLETLLEFEYDIDEFFDDEIRYPVDFENLGVMSDFGDRAEAVVMMWENIKPGSTVALLIILAVIAGVIGLAVGAYFLADTFKGRYKRIN